LSSASRAFSISFSSVMRLSSSGVIKPSAIAELPAVLSRPRARRQRLSLPVQPAHVVKLGRTGNRSSINPEPP
jgi:hypothetical protein